MEGETWAAISPEAKDFVSRCLVVDVRKRATLEDCLAHPWLSKDFMQVVELVGAFAKLQVYRSSRRESRSVSSSALQVFTHTHTHGRGRRGDGRDYDEARCTHTYTLFIGSRCFLSTQSSAHSCTDAHADTDQALAPKFGSGFDF